MLENKKLKVGETVIFGSWNGKPIQWLILDVRLKENKVLLISKKILETREYNKELIGITWENCSLRYYLQNEFLEKAFNSEERQDIIPVLNKNADNKFGIYGGNPTWDSIFLLSIEEINRYFKTDEEKIAKRLDNDKTWWYWLRSPGYGVYSHSGVRPAFWLQI